MRTQLKNTIAALTLRLVTMAIGLIMPQLMIRSYGSELYGLASSIGQFLSYAMLLEGGIAGVVRAVLYKALASKDNEQLSRIIQATRSFFNKLAMIMMVYVVALCFLYPRIINDTFEPLFTGSLIVIIAVSTLMQYCFGMTYSTLLQADKKLYVPYTVQTLTIVLNAVCTFVMIRLGASFHVVKLTSTMVFILRPLMMGIYVQRHYTLNRKAKPDRNALSQRWNGMAHHLAWFLHTNTDVAIITIFATLGEVSVYSLYYMVASSMTMIVMAMVSGNEAVFGNMMVTKPRAVVVERFSYYTMAVNALVIIFFSTAGTMLMSFISIYTSGITDADYHVPVLGFMLLVSEGIYCLRLPYYSIVTAAAHFKQTQTSAILEAAMNIILSVILICWMGLPGVAVATAVAMLYRTGYYLWYLSRNILQIPLGGAVMRVLAAAVIALGFVATKCILVPSMPENYLAWAGEAAIWGCYSVLLAGIYCLIFYPKQVKALIGSVKRKKA